MWINITTKEQAAQKYEVQQHSETGAIRHRWAESKTRVGEWREGEPPGEEKKAGKKKDE